jgi:hypothetical protein
LSRKADIKSILSGAERSHRRVRYSADPAFA